MCLAIPAKVIEINDYHAKVDIMGVTKKINIVLVEDLKIGDKVMVHAGYAINKINNEYFDFLNDTLKEMMDNLP